jgi:hypothetical protein
MDQSATPLFRQMGRMNEKLGFACVPHKAAEIPKQRYQSNRFETMTNACRNVNTETTPPDQI